MERSDVNYLIVKDRRCFIFFFLLFCSSFSFVVLHVQRHSDGLAHHQSHHTKKKLMDFGFFLCLQNNS